jgi:hypothetical protein
MPKFHLLLVAVLAGAADAAVSSAEKKEMLDLHNMYRCMAKVPALQWDDTLQKQAQSWADTGNTGHSTKRGAFKDYGENMQYACPKATPKTATDWWYDEINKYSESSPYQSSHYTQMVWKDSTKIGCGKGKAPCGGDLWVCQFTKIGNWNNAYKENVFAPTKSKAACAASASLYSSNVPNVGFAQSSAMLGAAAFFAATAFFTVVAGFRRWQARRVVTLAASEGDELEEAGKEGLCLE